ELDAGWLIGGGLNGGYLLAVMGNAVGRSLSTAEPVPGAVAGHRDPGVVSAHFLSACRPGPARVRTRVLRRGGRHSTVAATLVQSEDGTETERITMLATFGDLDRNDGEVSTTLVAPDLPPRPECVAAVDGPEPFTRAAPL